MLQLPAAFAAYRQFILFTTAPSQRRPGKVDKFPVDWRTGEVCNAHDAAAWCSADEARTALEVWPRAVGVGFVFTDADPFWFLDIDGAVNSDGQWSAVAQQLCQVFAGCAVEVSHSLKGLHIFGSGALPAHSTRCTPHGLELYHSGRFVALTGTSLTGDAGHTPAPELLQWLVSSYFAPNANQGAEVAGDWSAEPVPEWSGPTDDDELIARMLRTPVSAAAAFAGRASFRDLWEGNAAALGRAWPSSTGDTFDRSSADAALAAHLAWATGCNHERMRRLMERSALKRDKWERPDYVPDTVRRMAARTTKVMQDKPSTSVVPVHASAGPVVASTDGAFLAAAAGAIAPTLTNVINALRSAEVTVRLAYDTFKDRIVLGEGTAWRTFTDVDYVTLRTMFEAKGFKPVSAELMRDAVLGVAMGNTIDTAVEWLNSLQWDGVPRVDGAMARYFGTDATPYARAVGRYLFTALAGRVLVPGCQADMALILVGPQGVRKTTGVRALAPTLEAFGEVNLEHLDEDTARALRGRLVCEMAELRGLKGRDAESIRAWITRRVEQWTPKYREFETTFARRCVLIGTANGREILTDPEGNRRWLPIATTRVDADAIEADRAQLWAEGAALWRAHGVLWQEAQALADAEHAAFEDRDEWHEPVAEWLAKPRPPLPGEVPSPTPAGCCPFTLGDLARGALGVTIERLGMRESKRLGAILRKLNYSKTDARINGRIVKAWVACSPSQGQQA